MERLGETVYDIIKVRFFEDYLKVFNQFYKQTSNRLTDNFFSYHLVGRSYKSSIIKKYK